MNVLQTFEFAIISVLYLFTITQTIDLIAVPGEYTKKQVLVLTAYMASGCICSWNRDSSHPIVFLVATICFYSLLLIYNIMLFKTNKSTAVYVSVMILVLDSIFQSVGCILIELFYNVPLVKTQMKKIIVTAKTLYSHPKNVSKIYAALHTDLAW